MKFDVKDGRNGHAAAIDWQALKKEILAKLDLAAEYRALGVEFTDRERSSGWRECRAVGRTDLHPSAAINLATGIYKADGQDGEVLGFFDFALKYGGGNAGTKYLDVLESYAGKAGIPLPFAPRMGDKGRVEAVYPYRSAGGEVLYEVVRYRRDDGSKTFRQRRPDGKGGHIPNLNGVTPVPYLLPDLLDPARAEDPIWIVEGEKDAHRAMAEGFLATCNHQGSGNTKVWEQLAPHFAGRDCYVIPDNDAPGRKHAECVASFLGPVARLVKVVELPGLPAKGDLSDWFDAGGTADELGTLGARAPTWEPTVADPNRDATVADLRVLQSATAWAWPNWIPNAALTLLAAEPGIGKTRFAFDLCRRIYHGLPWPDGTPATVAAGGRFLWVAADNQWQEMCDIPATFEVPDDAIVLNSTAVDPYGGTNLQTDEDLADFEARIQRVRPSLVVIDTITNTGDFKSQDTSDAKKQYKPLQEIAVRCQVPILCVTHLNAGGKVLGRRATEKVRVVMQLECPDPDGQPNRRKLWVPKSKAVKPPPLGVTMGDEGNEYDAEPPAAPGPERINGAATGPPPAKTTECMNWLANLLSLGQARVSEVRRRAEQEGYSAKTIYRARDLLHVRETKEDGRLWWSLPCNAENGHPGEDLRPF